MGEEGLHVKTYDLTLYRSSLVSKEEFQKNTTDGNAIGKMPEVCMVEPKRIRNIGVGLYKRLPHYYAVKFLQSKVDGEQVQTLTMTEQF